MNLARFLLRLNGVSNCVGGAVYVNIAGISRVLASLFNCCVYLLVATDVFFYGVCIVCGWFDFSF